VGPRRVGGIRFTRFWFMRPPRSMADEMQERTSHIGGLNWRRQRGGNGDSPQQAMRLLVYSSMLV
jgi:hypothetical protein